MRVAEAIVDLVLPRRCAVCAAPAGGLCAPCRRQLLRLGPPQCERCGAPTSWPVARCRECSGRRLAFANARAAVAYDERVRALVAAWKEGGQRGLAALAAELVAEVVPKPRALLVTCVPPDPERGARRGFHPSEQLARELAERWLLPFGKALTRSESRRRQRDLPLAERQTNVRGVFGPAGSVSGTVVLIDDVYTSGATTAAASSALRQAGARRIDVVTFARAVR